MRDTLKDRTEAVSKLVEKMHFLDRAKHIQRFIEDELKIRETEYILTEQDLSVIHSSAVRENLSCAGNSSNSNELAKWWTMAVLSWLRGLDMLYFKVSEQKGDKHDFNSSNSNSSNQ